MTFPLPETAESSLSLEAEKEIFRLMEGKSAVAIGPGLSTHGETISLVKRIVARCPLPMVIDADGLNALASDLAALTKCRGRAILTLTPVKWPDSPESGTPMSRPIESAPQKLLLGSTAAALS